MNTDETQIFQNSIGVVGGTVRTTGMRGILKIAILAVILVTLSCKMPQAKWREQFLLSHGFHCDDTNDPTCYSRHYDTLGDAARDLGFSVTNLFVPVNSELGGPDVRVVFVQNHWGFVVTASGTDSLDQLTTPCTVGTATIQYTPKKYRATSSRPRLRIKSIVEPQEPSQPLQVTFEVAADGKTPVALSQDQFDVDIHTPGQPYYFSSDAQFSKHAHKVFKIWPRSPITLTVTAFTNRFEPGERWSQLPHGNYTLNILVSGGGKEQRFDYEWLGQTASDEYKILIN